MFSFAGVIVLFLFIVSVFTGCGGNSGSGGNGGGSRLFFTPNVYTPVSISRDVIALEIRYGRNGNQGVPGPAGPMGPPGAGAGSGNVYAGTNVQHEGIDEGDIIKVDGNYIYMLSREGLFIVSVSGQKMSLSCKMEYDNFYPDEMFVFEDTLIVIGGVYSQMDYGGWPIHPGIGVITPYWRWRTSTKIMIYDLNDRENPALLDEYEITGYFMTSRLIDNKLVVAVNHIINAYDEDTFFPKINDIEIDEKNIYVYPINQFYNYTIIASINIDSLKLDYSAHLGIGGEIYVSADNLYFFCGNYETATGALVKYKTIIVKISLNTLKYGASGKIDGTVSNRYWADEYNNYLRVVSHVNDWPSQRHTVLNVLDRNLNVTGMISGIAPGEGVYAVRFNGDEGSIVTFLQIDPLFKLDLSDPKAPGISDGLKEDGVSDYLQYLDENTVLGLGREGDGTGWLFGISVSLYDNSGDDAVNIAQHVFKNGNDSINYYVYSEALWNPKAILNDPANNLFAFAVDLIEDNKRANGLAVFKYDLSASEDKDKLLFEGILSNIEPKSYYSGRDWEEYYNDYLCHVTRGVRIGGKIYTVSERYITGYDIGTLKLIERFDIFGNAETL